VEVSTVTEFSWPAAEVLGKKKASFYVDSIAEEPTIALPRRYSKIQRDSPHSDHAKQASDELTGYMEQYGIVSKMLNDFQNGLEGNSIYSDEPEFDISWETVQQLDVVICIRPRFYHRAVNENLIFGSRSAMLRGCRQNTKLINLVDQGFLGKF
jgi:hypothetical protein